VKVASARAAAVKAVAVAAVAAAAGRRRWRAYMRAERRRPALVPSTCSTLRVILAAESRYDASSGSSSCARSKQLSATCSVGSGSGSGSLQGYSGGARSSSARPV